MRVHDDEGNLLGIVDFVWRELGVFLEFDGRIKYAEHRRPGESLADYLLREKRREEQICVSRGWICIRITWADLQRPVVLARRIRRRWRAARPGADRRPVRCSDTRRPLQPPPSDGIPARAGILRTGLGRGRVGQGQSMGRFS